MLQFKTSEVLTAINVISHTAAEFQLLVKMPQNPNMQASQSLEHRANILRAVQMLQEIADEFGLPASKRIADQTFKICLDALAVEGGVYRPTTYSTIHSNLQGLCNTFIAEASSLSLYLMPRGGDQFHKSADDLFGTNVVDAFPEIQFDAEEAGKCFAFGLWTAAVNHLMRVLEVGLEHLALSFEVTHDANWNKTLNQIEKRLREVRKSEDGAEAEQWAAEAGTHLRFVKNAWRNQAAHPGRAYDEEKSKAIFGNVRSFMQHLAEKLPQVN